MKAFWIGVLALAVGTGGGVVASVVRFQRVGARLDELRRYANVEDEASLPAALPQDSGPKAVISPAERVHDFGFMAYNERDTHTFVIRNGGDKPLELTFGYLSCRKCTTANMEPDETRIVEPDEAAEIVLTWNARTPSETFRQGARVLTNDPANKVIDLVITGKVDRSLRIEPPKLVIGDFPAGEQRSFFAEVLSTTHGAIEITKAAWKNQELAPYFEVENRRIDADSLDSETARSGQLLRITVHPGMPLGPFEQALLVHTNDEKAREIPLEIVGTVVGPISITGSIWNEKRGYLALGDVQSSEGAKHSVFIKSTGEAAADLELKVARVFPDFLKVELGDVNATGEGPETRARVLMTVEIPPGTRAANHQGTVQGKLGEIVLETNHPLARQFKIGVKFVVEKGN